MIFVTLCGQESLLPWYVWVAEVLFLVEATALASLGLVEVLGSVFLCYVVGGGGGPHQSQFKTMMPEIFRGVSGAFVENKVRPGLPKVMRP